MLTEEGLEAAWRRHAELHDVLVEGLGEMELESKKARHKPVEQVSIGRSYRDAPEVDGIVIIRGQPPVGQLARIRITQATEYDLIGVPE